MGRGRRKLRGRAAVKAAEALSANAARIDSRRQRLIDERAASEEIAGTTKTDRLVNEANLKRARMELALLLEGTRQEQLDQQREEVEVQRANLALLRYRLGRATLKAPNAGIIRNRIQEPGAVIMSNTPVLSLALTDPLWCRTYIDEPDLSKIRRNAGAAH